MISRFQSSALRFILAAYEDKCALEHAEDCLAFAENVMVNLPDVRGQEMTLVSNACHSPD